MNDAHYREYRRNQKAIDAWAVTAVSAIAQACGGLDDWRRSDVFMEVLHIWGAVKADDYSPMPSPMQRFKDRQGEFFQREDAQ